MLVPVHWVLFVTRVFPLLEPDPADPQASVEAVVVDVDVDDEVNEPPCEMPGDAKLMVTPERWHVMARGVAEAIDGPATAVTAVAPSGIAIAAPINNSFRIINSSFIPPALPRD